MKKVVLLFVLSSLSGCGGMLYTDKNAGKIGLCLPIFKEAVESEERESI